MTRSIPKPPSARLAFSLVEVLVVVAVIGILSTLLVLGVEKMVLNAKRQQTRAALAQCQSMFADWDTATHLNFPPSVMPCPQNVTDAFSPANVPQPSPGAPAVDESMAPSVRYGAAVWFTRDFMFNLRSTPNNAAALGKMSAGSLMTFPTPYNSAFPNPYVGSVAEWSGTLPYAPFRIAPASPVDDGRVYITDASNNRVYYQCIKAVDAPSGPTNASPAVDRGHWLQAYPVMGSSGTVPLDDAVPVLLDGWGNPIIFVPGGTLGTGAALNPDGTVKLGSGSMRSGTGLAAVLTKASSPDGRPFFASAGPDGDFSNGDDNLYSFEK